MRMCPISRIPCVLFAVGNYTGGAAATRRLQVEKSTQPVECASCLLCLSAFAYLSHLRAPFAFFAVAISAAAVGGGSYNKASGSCVLFAAMRLDARSYVSFDTLCVFRSLLQLHLLVILQPVDGWRWKIQQSQ